MFRMMMARRLFRVLGIGSHVVRVKQRPTGHAPNLDDSRCGYFFVTGRRQRICNMDEVKVPNQRIPEKRLLLWDA